MACRWPRRRFGFACPFAAWWRRCCAPAIWALAAEARGCWRAPRATGPPGRGRRLQSSCRHWRGEAWRPVPGRARPHRPLFEGPLPSWRRSRQPAPLDSIGQDDYPLHWAQAKVYAYLYLQRKGLERAQVRLCYYQLHTAQTLRFTRVFGLEELQALFDSLTQAYLAARAAELDHAEALRLQLRQAPFPTRPTAPARGTWPPRFTWPFGMGSGSWSGPDGHGQDHGRALPRPQGAGRGPLREALLPQRQGHRQGRGPGGGPAPGPFPAPLPGA